MDSIGRDLSTLEASPPQLINHYHHLPEEEKRRFLRYCENTLQRSSSNGLISNLNFLHVLNTYCGFRSFRDSSCLVDDNSTFQTLPTNVQLAFLSAVCRGTREARLQCLQDLKEVSTDIHSPVESSLQICSATYPLIVNFGMSAAETEAYKYQTDVDERSTANVFQSSGVRTYTVDFGNDDMEKKAKKDVKAPQLGVAPSPPSTGLEPPRTTTTSTIVEQPTEPETTARTQPTQALIATVGQSIEATAEQLISSAPKHPQSSQETTMTASSSAAAPPMTATTMATPLSPTWRNDYTNHSSKNTLMRPMGSEEASFQQNDDENKALVIGLVVGMVLLPLVALLLVKAYQRQKDPRRKNSGPALLEDFSVISENSANLVRAGAKFRKSDEISIPDDSSRQNIKTIAASTNMMAHHIRQAFSRMYEYLDDDISEQFSPKKAEERLQREAEELFLEEATPIAEPKRLQRFKPNPLYSNQNTTDLQRVNAGTVLLPSDYIYAREFQSSCENSATQAGKRLATPIFLSKTSGQVLYNRSEPIIPSLSAQLSDSSSIHSKSIRIDVMRDPKFTNNLRIIGLVPDPELVVVSSSSASCPTDDDVSTWGREAQFEHPPPLLSSTLFGQLSNELDAIMSKEFGVMIPSETEIPELQAFEPRKRSRSVRGDIPTIHLTAPRPVSSMSLSTISTIPETNAFCNAPVFSAFQPFSRPSQPVPHAPQPSSHAPRTKNFWSENTGTRKASRAQSVISTASREGVEAFITDNGDVALRSSRSARERLPDIV